MTSRKTSQGPQKSITTAPSEMTNATGMGGDGLSELVTGLLVGAAAMKIATGISNVSIVRIGCFKFDRAFMHRSCIYSCMAAMTTITMFLPYRLRSKRCGKTPLSFTWTLERESFARALRNADCRADRPATDLL